MEQLLEQFLIKNNYTNFDENVIKLQLQTHPNYPSFLSITETLNYFNIENLAAKIPTDSLAILPDHFLSLIIQGNTKELVLVSKKGQQIKTRNAKGEKKTLTENAFIAIWENSIIAIEPGRKKLKKTKIKIIWIFLITTIIFGLLFLQGISFIEIFLLIMTSAGIYLGYLLIKEKIGEHSQAVYNICNIHQKTNCNEVINSKGSKIFDYLDLSDLTFIFFSSLMLFQLFFQWSSFLNFILLTSIPIVLYSIYYQAVILKKWCVLCLAVSGLLIVFTSIAILNYPLIFLIIDAVQFILIISLVAFSFTFAKNQYIIRKKLFSENISLRRFKRDPEIFQHIFSKAKVFERISPIPKEITLGNPEASFQITVVTNPLCGFCKTAFENYLKILNTHQQNIKLVIRFSVRVDNLEHPSTKISTRLIEIYHEKGNEKFIKSYKGWFENRNVVEWLSSHGEPKFDKITLNILIQQKEWIQSNDLNYTPATIVENRMFPKNYSYEDLPHLINDITTIVDGKNVPDLAETT
ncbi:vitamin K epoxide reductase family protein [Christiangramia sp.]|uniref:vitamin K epoxide reductase family protein n=1 Tax=Christiangramia sp. TaxID=1931228 RepID=UPI0026274ED6|nr:vitamin K epoxide reductase family protein [Christiangramia sp.]